MRDWLSHRVVSSPEDTALVRAEDGEAWTYTDLDQLVSETAGRLVAHGVEAGDTLGVLTPPYVGTVGLIHAAMRIGATFVPLGEGLTERELAERIESVELSAVVCAESTENKALGAVERTKSVPVFSVDAPVAESVTAVHEVEPEPVASSTWEFDDVLCILFTSGTTGDPKPVPLTTGNVYSSAVASAFRLGLGEDDRWLVSLALHHTGGLAPVYRSALYGTTLILREGFDPGGTADDIDTFDATGVSLVPTMLQQMLDRRGTLSDSLRVVLLGGAPASDELLERCRDYSIPVYPTYGMTEAASQIATATPRQTQDRLNTVGRPIFGTDVSIVDADGTAVGPGETGEIVVDGPTVTGGYIDSDNGTEDLDRSEFGQHGLHTGDVGRLDEDGYLYVLNRVDDRILSGGENVEPGEVVDVLCEFPAVEDVAVVGLEDDVWGERVSALIATGDQFHTDDNSDLADDSAHNGDAEGDSGLNQNGDGMTTEGDSDASDIGDSDASNIGDGDADSEHETDRNTDETTNSDDDTAVDTKPEGDIETSNSTAAAPDQGHAEMMDESALVEFADDRLAGFKLPKTVAYVSELPRTVSGTIDREAVKTVLRTRGHDPREGLEGELETAGFKPADPTDPPESEPSDQEFDTEGDHREGDGMAGRNDTAAKRSDAEGNDTTETDVEGEPDEETNGSDDSL